VHFLLLWIYVLYCALVAEFLVFQNMETQGKVDNIEDKGDGSGHVTWNTATSAFMLNYFAKMVSNGTKTSSGFKKVHLNMCA
jgi:purine-cytosine permease-like protein